MNSKSKFEVNESVNPSDFDLTKIVRFRQHLNSDSNSDTSPATSESMNK